MPDRHDALLDAHALFRRAESFFFASTILQKQPPAVMGIASFATITNYAFALEAYLKVLAQLQKHEPPLYTHNLRDLFHDLLPETQRAARRAFLKGNGGPAEMKKKAREHQKHMPEGLKMPQSFEEALDLSAQAFIEWRYNSTKPCSFHIIGLIGIIRDVVLREMPDWRPYKGHVLTILNPHPDFAKPQDEEARKPFLVPLDPKAAPIDVRFVRRSNPKDRGPNKAG